MRPHLRECPDKALAKAHAEYERFRQVLDELPSPAERDFEAAADLFDGRHAAILTWCPQDCGWRPSAQ